MSLAPPFLFRRLPPRAFTGVLTPGAISVITDESAYNAWPVVCRLANNNLIVAYTKGDQHHGSLTGRPVVKQSANDGGSWSSEVVIIDLTGTWWITVMGIAQTNTGRIIATLFRDKPGTSPSGEAGMCYSDDDGATWSAWVALTNGFTRESYGSGQVIQLANDDLLLTIEGNNTGQTSLQNSSHTLLSSDDGATWGSEVTVRNYVTDTRPYYESKLVKLASGDLLCMHRTSAGTGTHYISRSTDDGATWAAPTSEFTGYAAPATIQSSWGTLICITRANSDAACIAYTSIDDGITWSSAYVLDDTMFEMEYGQAVETLDGRYLVVYGYQPTSSINNADIKQIYVTEAIA